MRSHATMLVLVATLAGTVTGLAPARAEPGPGWVDPDEAAELLADLAEDGVVLGHDDWARLGLPEPGTSTAAVEPLPSRTPGRLQWSWDLAAAADAPPRTGLRADGRHGDWRLRGRWRRDDDGDVVAGVLTGAAGPLEIAAGGVGLHHGFGLLAAAPGRAPGAAAWQGLGPSGAGVRTSGGVAVERRYAGVAMTGAWGPLVACGLVGAADPDGTTTDGVRALRLALVQAGLELGILATTAGAARGGAMSLAGQAGPLRLAAEAAAWQRRPAAAREGACAVAARYAGGAWCVEAQAALARAQDSPAGRRPVCLSGWDGHGWAVRVQGPLGEGVRGSVLVALARDRPSLTVADDRSLRRQWDAGLVGHLDSGAVWEVRWRWRVDERWAWLEGAPWQPPHVARLQEKQTLLVRVGRPLAAGTFRAGWRSYAVDVDGTTRRRQLLDVGWQGRRAGLELRLGFATAWGDPADLQSVTVPLSGLILPRHWGAWSGEALAGCEGRIRSWRWQAAVVRREPVGGPPLWEAWLRVGTGPGSTQPAR